MEEEKRQERHKAFVHNALAEAKQLERSGVRTMADELLEASCLIKCVGFYENHGTESLLSILPSFLI